MHLILLVAVLLAHICINYEQKIKWAIFITVPVWFGYGFARDPDNLEWVKQVVSPHEKDVELKQTQSTSARNYQLQL